MANMEVEREEPDAATSSADVEAGVKETIDEATLDVRAFVEAHPIGAVATALGVGYVLGGGLFTRLTSKLVGLGVRFAVLPVLERELAGLAGNLGKADTTVGDDLPEASTAH
ncbi:MAG TPA: hypothetical protein VH560_01145 [Polyangia bacterium]|jgi:hypothetical protein|nr:hypothetical protein [Polyangia bacterium]